MCNKSENAFILTSEKNNKVLFEVDIKAKSDDIDVIVFRETFKDLIVVYGVNLDKKTTLHGLFEKSKSDNTLGPASYTYYISSLIYRDNESSNTIYEHNFIIETHDKWDNVPKYYTNSFDVTRSKNGVFYYAQYLSVKGEGPPLPDSYFNENGFVEEPTLHLALATAEYYSSYFDQEEPSIEKGGYITTENFVIDTHVLGGQEYVEAKYKADVNDAYGWLSFLSYDSLFWRIIDGCGSGIALGIAKKGVPRQTSTVPSTYGYSRPNIRIDHKTIYSNSSNTSPACPNLPILKRSLTKREIGSFTKIEFKDGQVYAWLKSKGGVGPIRKHRINKTTNRARIKQLEKETIELIPPFKD